ncbi:MAG: UDP-2,4-diacetamido-2,4,6-trideoxy-beta-L-altropyranose hydrolase [Paracoccaceae bacterium]
MRLAIRADASQVLGVGHVMRCLTLAEAARARTGDAIFVMRALQGHMAAALQDRGFACHMLDEELPPADDAAQTARIAHAAGADWVLVDHYGLDAVWENAQALPVMAIDDLTDRPHAAEVLLNQNRGASEDDYTDLIAPGTQCLMGTDYALLRPEFAAARGAALKGRANRGLHNLLISLGGTDPVNATGWVLQVLSDLDLTGIDVAVVMGGQAPFLEEVRSIVATMPYATLVVDSRDMAGLMARADLAIGAAGSTSWERCCLGLPALMVVLADNQAGIAQALDGAGAARRIELGNADALSEALSVLRSDEAALVAMQTAAAAICDGRGAERVLDCLTGQCADKNEGAGPKEGLGQKGVPTHVR